VGTFPDEDYGILIAEAEAIGAKSALEFGPGESTMAFLQAGCTRVLTLEHDRKWLRKAQQRFAGYDAIEVGTYTNTPTINASAGACERFDIAFVDSPVGTVKRRVIHAGQEDCSRLNTVQYALTCASVVLLHDARREGEQRTLERMKQMGWNVKLYDTERGMARISAL